MGHPRPDGGPSGPTTTVDYAALEGIRNRFNDLAAAFRNAKAPLGQDYDKAIAGAGQFSGRLETGAVKFLLTWRETFGVCEESSGLIAANIGKTSMDIKATDIDSSTAIQL